MVKIPFFGSNKASDRKKNRRKFENDLYAFKLIRGRILDKAWVKTWEILSSKEKQNINKFVATQFLPNIKKIAEGEHFFPIPEELNQDITIYNDVADDTLKKFTEGYISSAQRFAKYLVKRNKYNIEETPIGSEPLPEEHRESRE